jgi:hypothetical protein
MKLKLCFIIVAVFLSSLNYLSAQALVEDGKISVTPNWTAGETVNYEYTRISYFKEKKKEEGDTLELNLELTVAEVLDTNLLMQAKYSLVNTEAVTNQEKLTKDIYHGTKLYYTTKANGSFEDLTSMNLLISVVRYALEKNWKVFQENPNATQKPTKDQIMDYIDRVFAQNAEGFIKNQIKLGEIFQYLHGFYGDKLNMEDTTMFVRKLQNPFDEQEYEINSIAKINKLDSDEGIIDVSISIETNEKEGFLLAFEFFSAIEKQIEEQDDAPATKIKMDMNYVVDLATGWVKSFTYTRTADSEDAHFIDKKTVKMLE